MLLLWLVKNWHTDLHFVKKEERADKGNKIELKRNKRSELHIRNSCLSAGSFQTEHGSLGESG